MEFDEEEWAAFTEALEDALEMYGAAEGQDPESGYVALAAGDPEPVVHEFDLTRLLARCRAADRGEWPDLCLEQVTDWSENYSLRAWLTAVPFAEVAGRLEAWPAAARLRHYEAPPEDDHQPFSVERPDGTWLAFLVEGPALDGVAGLRCFVPWSAVRAWGMTGDELVQRAHA
ncbi:hypothetical protein [Dactylosporangium sp. NPDC049140]|uniref:hypothetical protein n=1 Tax=Dactylosporangium sp. NPDC049140 TaxID=3155647 RepID=UPI0033E30622